MKRREKKSLSKSERERERGRGEGFLRDGFHKTNAVQPKVKFANSSYCRLLSFANETTLGWGYGDNNDLRAHTHKIKEYAELPVRHKNDHFRTKSNYCPVRRRVYDLSVHIHVRFAHGCVYSSGFSTISESPIDEI